MRTVNATLSAACLAGTGIPVVRLNAHYRSTLPTIEASIDVVSYQLTRLGLQCRTKATNLPPTEWQYSDMFTLSRGLSINGTEYLIDSPYFYFNKRQTIRNYSDNFNDYTFLLWDTSQSYNISTPADASAQTVIENAQSVGCTAAFITGEPWLAWQYEKTGTNLNLKSFNGLLPQIWNKYTCKMFPRDLGTILYQTKLCTSYATPTTYTWPSDQLTIIDGKRNFSVPRWNAFWENETGATSRLSAHIAGPENYPLRNVGFIPSTAALDDIINLYYLNATVKLHEWKYTLPFTPELEQGDLITVSSKSLLASVKESFNMPGTTYPWQTEVTGENMYFVYQE